MKIRKALILSAGFGKRLRPLTLKKPKPLLKIGNKTLLSNTIELLQKYGIKDLVINTHYLSKSIKKYIKQKKFKVNIKIINEKYKILDTGGGILNSTKNFSNEPFFVLNPDTIWNINYLKELKKMENFFFEKNCNGVLLLVKKNKSFDKSFRGDFNLKNHIVKREIKNHFIYTGAQILCRKIFSKTLIHKFSINRIWDQMIQKELLFGIESKQKFLHTNNLKIYKKILRYYFKD